MDEQDIPESIETFSEKTGLVERQVSQQKSLESLLLDDSGDTRSVERIAEQEVRVVSKRTTGRSGSFLTLILLGILLLGMGYYSLDNMPSQNPPASEQNHYVSPKLPVPVRPKIEIPVVGVIVEKDSYLESDKDVIAAVPLVDIKAPLYTVTVGPFIQSDELQHAISSLQELGLHPQKSLGYGQVSMIRLLEGIYPEAEARAHLVRLKKAVNSAFILPSGDKLAVYSGSFHQRVRAQQMRDDLANKRIDVTLVDSEITMKGTMLAALQADQQTAREVAAHISSLGLHTQVSEKK